MLDMPSLDYHFLLVQVYNNHWNFLVRQNNFIVLKKKKENKSGNMYYVAHIDNVTNILRMLRCYNYYTFHNI